jgi:ankyrin repeat protein
MRLIYFILTTVTFVTLVSLPLHAMDFVLVQKALPTIEALSEDILAGVKEEDLIGARNNLSRTFEILGRIFPEAGVYSDPIHICDGIENLNNEYPQFATQMLDVVLAKSGRSFHESRSKNGWTPLMWSAKSGKTQVMQLLLTKTTSVEKLLFAIDDLGNTALHWAAHQGQIGALVVLLDSFIESLGDDATWELLSTKGKWGDTALHHATVQRNKTIVDRILTITANRFGNEKAWELINEKNNAGESALDLASKKLIHIMKQYDRTENPKENCLVQ